MCIWPRSRLGSASGTVQADVRRSYVLSIAGALVFCLIATSPQRLVGDGREYLAQAINFASFHGPGLRPRDIGAVQSEMARFDPDLASWDIRGASIPDARRSRDFAHFWFYSLLASPGLWITRPLGLPPTLAFTALNVLLSFAALWIALPRLGASASLLLFASPVVWWIDKAHTEVFTFSLLVMAFALYEEQPWWSMVAAGAAAIQNPPIAVVVPIVWIATVLRDRARIAERRVLAGAVTGGALSLVHPAYVYVRHQTPSLLLMMTRSEAPGTASLTAVVLDPSIGLLGNFPLFIVVVVLAAAVLVRCAAAGRPPVVTSAITGAALAGAVFLLAFSRTTNIHHGGTPSLSRYAIWLIPLAAPLLSAVKACGWRRWQWSLRIAAVTSAVISITAFRPSVPQNSREPTLLASVLWTRLPSWNNPLPEVFSETILHIDDLQVPVATDGCEKILVGGAPSGVWPIPCYPAELPVACTQPTGLCYANRGTHGYEFTRAPGGAAGTLRGNDVWPAAAERHVRRLFDAWEWPALDFTGRDRTMIADAHGVTVTPVGSAGRFILVLRNPRAGAGIRLRVARPMQGALVDADTGATLAVHSCSPSDNGCDVQLPVGPRLLLLAMREL